MIPNVSTQTVPQAPSEPTILVNIAYNDPTRGDSAGWRGMARGMAKKLGGRVVYADEKTVRAAFPEEDESAEYEALLARYIQEFNPPEAVFGHDCSDTLRELGQDPDDVYTMTRINEGITSDMLGENELVAHHLTPEMMEEEGKKFDEMHPKIKKPVISVMLMDPYSDSDRQAFAERTVKLMSHYPEATIYLCGSRHTSEDNYNDLMDRINKEVAKQGVKKKIDVTGYKFDREATYNPYKGLIARSKHIVVWGSSQSLVTEALYSGKTVYLHETYGFSETKEKKPGYLATFNELALGDAPLSKEFEPVNLTDQLVDKLIEEKDKKEADVDLRVLRRSDSERDAQWDEHLRAIRRNHRAAQSVPDELKKNPKFVKSALKIRGFSLKYFPDFQEDKDMVSLAVAQNRRAIRFIGQALKGFKGYVENLMSSTNCVEVFTSADEELKSDPAFVKVAMKLDRHVFEHVDEALKNDRDFVVDLLDSQLIAAYQVPGDLAKQRDILLRLCALEADILQTYDEYINDPEFALEAVDANMHCYKYFGHDARADKAVATMAISKYPDMITYAPDILKKDPDIVRTYIKAGGYWGNVDVSVLDDDTMRGVVEDRPDALEYASDALKKDRNLARIVLEKNIGAFRFFADELRDDKTLVGPLLAKNPELFGSVGPKIHDDFKLAKSVVLKNPGLFQTCSPRLQKSPSFVRSIVAKHPKCFEDLPRAARELKGIEDLAVKKRPENLAYCSEEYRKQPHIVQDVLKNKPELFYTLTREDRGDKNNIRRIINSRNAEAIKGIDGDALAKDTDFLIELLDTLGDDDNRKWDLLAGVRTRGPFRSSRRAVLAATAAMPGMVNDFLGEESYRNIEFMKQVVTVPGVKARHLMLPRSISTDVMKGILEVRPDFIADWRFEEAVFAGKRRLSPEAEQEALDAQKISKVVVRTVKKKAQSITEALNAAAKGLVQSKKPAHERVEEPAEPVEIKSIDMAGQVQLAKKLSEQMNKGDFKSVSKDIAKLIKDNKPPFIPKEYPIKKNTYLKKDALKNAFVDACSNTCSNDFNSMAAFTPKYGAFEQAAETLEKPVISDTLYRDGKKYKFHSAAAKEYVAASGDIEGRVDVKVPFSTHSQYDNAIIGGVPNSEVERLSWDGVKPENCFGIYLLADEDPHVMNGETKCGFQQNVHKDALGMLRDESFDGVDLSDKTAVPENALIGPAVGESNAYVGLYAPETEDLEIALKDKTIAVYDIGIDEQYVQQVGQDVWVRPTENHHPIVMKDCVIGAAKPGCAEGVVGIYQRTDRKVTPKSTLAHAKNAR